jgi:hypothetical protein
MEHDKINGRKLNSSEVSFYNLDPDKSLLIKIDDRVFLSLPFKRQRLIDRGIVRAVGLTESGELAEFNLSFEKTKGLVSTFRKVSSLIRNPDITPSARCKSKLLGKLETLFGSDCEIIGPSNILPY